jgi:ZIP family zinc transporter
VGHYGYGLLLALVPGGGNFVGGLLGELLPTSPRALSRALHAATGVVIAMVALEITPHAEKVGPPWLMIVAFVVGGIIFFLMDSYFGIIERRGGNEPGEGGPWLIYISLAVDLLTDGVIIGTALHLSLALAFVLAFGQLAANVPGGFATTATLRHREMRRVHRVLLLAAGVLPVIIGVTLGYLLLDQASESIKAAILVLVAGVLTTMAVEEMLPQAHEAKDSRSDTLWFIIGFTAFWVISLQNPSA